MADVRKFLQSIEQGQVLGAETLLPIVYEELRRLAAARLAHRTPEDSLDGTELVHEAYLRLVGEQKFENRRHFFAAAAEAMRRIVVERARYKHAARHGGGWRRTYGLSQLPSQQRDIAEVLAVHDLLDRLAEKHPRQAEVVKLRFFLECTFVEIGKLLGISPDSAESDWAFAREWFRRELASSPNSN
jgi:RNA polymerase sigma factor (TIGR02999 family)